MIQTEPFEHKNPIPRVQICKVRDTTILPSMSYYFYSCQKKKKVDYHILLKEYKAQDT